MKKNLLLEGELQLLCYGTFLLIIFLQAICYACSFAKNKILELSDSIQESRVENTLEKINSGDLKIKSYIVVGGDKLWNIAEDLLKKSNINDVDVRDVIDIIKDINDTKNIDVSVLSAGQEIYIPADLKDVV